ncbi:MAG: hypothetical protein MSA49_02350 [Clostridia bacterium]|nr:hypothetical protein [Clostridia bacterium]
MHSHRHPHRIRRLSDKISTPTLFLLNGFLPILALAFLWFGVQFFQTARQNPLYAVSTYRETLHSLMLSLTIVIGGSALFDISLHETHRPK